jgi:HEAT repeat protein
MIRQSRWRPSRWRRISLAASFLLVASVASAAPIFKLTDDSTVVVRGVVDGVQRYKGDAFLVFTITPHEVLKGTVEKGVPLKLVEERVFGSERPYFEKGVETLVFAVPLPPYSYYRQSLPSGTYLKWTDRKETGSTVAALGDPAVAQAVVQYLATKDDAHALAHHLATLLASPVLRLRVDALDAIGQHHELAAALDASALAPVATLLADDHVPVAERGTILLGLAQAGATGASALAAEVVKTRGPLQAAGVDTLVIAGQLPREEQLLGWSHSEDLALRSAAVRGLAAMVSSRAARDRLADVVRTDPSSDVRVAAVRALGTSHNPGAVPILRSALLANDEAMTTVAGDALARLASPEAVHALGEVLLSGNFEAEASAAFALAQCARQDAVVILREQRDAHPDERVRRVIKLALGEHIEEHDE